MKTYDDILAEAIQLPKTPPTELIVGFKLPEEVPVVCSPIIPPEGWNKDLLNNDRLINGNYLNTLKELGIEPPKQGDFKEIVLCAGVFTKIHVSTLRNSSTHPLGSTIIQVGLNFLGRFKDDPKDVNNKLLVITKVQKADTDPNKQNSLTRETLMLNLRYGLLETQKDGKGGFSILNASDISTKDSMSGASAYPILVSEASKVFTRNAELMELWKQLEFTIIAGARQPSTSGTVEPEAQGMSVAPPAPGTIILAPNHVESA